jgi:hypothetical protein
MTRKQNRFDAAAQEWLISRTFRLVLGITCGLVLLLLIGFICGLLALLAIGTISMGDLLSQLHLGQ